jgi:hypothetical protein
MILSLIESYVNYNVAELNSALSSNADLKEVNNLIGNNEKSTAESKQHYSVYIDSTKLAESVGSNFFDVAVKIEFEIGLYNKGKTNYKLLFDRYLWNLNRTFLKNERQNGAYTDNTISTALFINNITDIQITNGMNIEGDYFKPTIDLELTVSDSGINNVQNIMTTGEVLV